MKANFQSLILVQRLRLLLHMLFLFCVGENINLASLTIDNFDLRRLADQQTSHQVYLKFLNNMIIQAINYCWLKNVFLYLSVKLKHFLKFLYSALLVKEINIVLKWRRPSSPLKLNLKTEIINGQNETLFHTSPRR